MTRLPDFELKQLKGFFSVINTFRNNPDSQVITAPVDGVATRIDKKNVLKMLRRNFPSFNKEEFKDDDSLIKYLSDRRNKNALLKQLPDEQKFELEEIRFAEEQANEQSAGQETPTQEAASTEQAAGSSGGGMFGGGGGSSSTAYGRIIHDIPRAPEEKPEILTAGKGGQVIEKGDPSKLVTATEGGQIKEPGEPSKLVQATRGGEIKEAGQPSKLVTTKGGITQEPYKPPSTIHIADRGTMREYKIPSQTRFNTAFRSAGRKVGSFANKSLERANPFLGRMGNNLISSLGGIVNPRGAFMGTGGGGIFGRFSRIGRGGGGGGTRGLLGKASKANSKRLIIGIVIAFALLMGFLTMFAPQQTTETTPSPAPVVATDINNCQFTRSGTGSPIKSSILAGWITDAANSAGIPPSVMASVAIHENPDFVTNADDNHDAIKSGQLCNRGIIFCELNGQVLHSIEGQDDPCSADEIANGARTAQAVGLMQLLDIYNPGKDLCSITENLNTAAAKLKADGVTQSPTQDQVLGAIRSYYGGSCEYGSGYSYCNEVWQDFQNCQTVASTGGNRPGAPSVDPSGLQASLVSQFGITMNGFDDQHLQWAWEKLWEVSSTRFNTYVRGSVIEAAGYSDQVGCPGAGVAVHLSQYDQTLFKYALIHELGHVVRNCNSFADIKYIEHLNAFNTEGGVTYYANNAAICTGSDNQSEDYAEMISRYLTPNTGLQLLRGNPANGCIPPATESVNLQTSFPLHYNVARSVLGDY